MNQRVKVSFPLPQEQGGSVEGMYAQPIGNGKFILDNSPFYYYGISFCDEFFAHDVDGELVFTRVASRGGHSTYRIKIPSGKDHAYFLNFWRELEKEGCTYEGSSANANRLYSIDIPPGVDAVKVYQIMEDLENQGVWEFEEGHYYDPKGEKFRTDRQ